MTLPARRDFPAADGPGEAACTPAQAASPAGAPSPVAAPAGSPVKKRCKNARCKSTVLGDGLDFCTAHVKDDLGISYRMLDHYVAQGYLRPVHAGGSGRPRSWPPEELDIARRMAGLLQLGLTPAGAAEVARNGWPWERGHPSGRDSGGNWRDRARCAEVDAEIYFPKKGESSRAAKVICRSCEVRDPCLEYAIRMDEPDGIWGGLSRRERVRVRDERLRAGSAA